jgi:hypothetical protein
MHMALDNTYAISINAGTLELRAGGRLGGGSHAGAITNNGTFIAPAQTTRYSRYRILAAEISPRTPQASTLTLSGNKTYIRSHHDQCRHSNNWLWRFSWRLVPDGWSQFASSGNFI